MHFVYILRNNTDNLYIGQTQNINERLARHHAGQGARFVNDRDFILVYSEKCNNLQEAMRREKQLKGWIRAKKEALVAGDLELLKKL